jgi:hypothetical protein
LVISPHWKMQLATVRTDPQRGLDDGAAADLFA